MNASFKYFLVTQPTFMDDVHSNVIAALTTSIRPIQEANINKQHQTVDFPMTLNQVVHMFSECRAILIA